MLSAKKIRIGRGNENEIVIPCNTVSTGHCEFRMKGKNGSKFEIIDLGSTNGTHLNEEELHPEDDARELRDGDSLKSGLDVKARFFQLEEIGDTESIPKPKVPSVADVAGAVTVKLKKNQKPEHVEPSINPVAAAVARAENGQPKIGREQHDLSKS